MPDDVGPKPGRRYIIYSSCVSQHIRSVYIAILSRFYRLSVLQDILTAPCTLFVVVLCYYCDKRFQTFANDLDCAFRLSLYR